MDETADKPKRPTGRDRDWTERKQQEFLYQLSCSVNVRASARAVNMSEQRVYRLRERSPEFRAAWDVALRKGYDRLELVMLERAINGTNRPIVHRLILSDATPEAVSIDPAELGAGGRPGHRIAIDRQASGTLPDEVTLTYYEPARDFQSGMQRARRGGPGRRVDAIELAAALDAGTAKAVVERRLADAWAGRATATADLAGQRLDLRPGDIVANGDGPAWRIGGWSLEGMTLSLKLRAVPGGSHSVTSAQAGRATAGIDAVHGPTTIALIDLPPIDDGVTGPRLWLAAAGVSPGWRRAAVIVSVDGGASWQEVGGTVAPATIGTAEDALPPGDTTLFDDVSVVTVVLLNQAMELVSRDDDALAGGANAAMLGDELIQFGRAEPLGGDRWRLSRLLRGRRGTEAATSGHVAGDRFVRIEPETLMPIDVPADRIGGEVRVIVSGVADVAGVTATMIATGRALRPLSPVHPAAVRLAGGGLRFGWTRRSRAGWAWTDGGEVPLAEETERYRIEIVPSVGAARTREVTSPFHDHGAGDIAADGAGAATTFAIRVWQLGAAGASPEPLVAHFTAEGDRL